MIKIINFKILITSILITFYSCNTSIEKEVVYASEHLRIEKYSANSYVHISYLDTDLYGKVPCNGMLVIDNNEALVFDTPTSNEASQELIDWLKEDLNVDVRVVVVSHFHVDALGGLDTFHNNGIASFANTITQEIAKKEGVTIPKYGIAPSYEHTIGQMKVLSLFVGEGHSKDNIVAYVPKDEILFGGCLVKKIGAGKGNLQAANVEEWPKTIEKLKQIFPNVTLVIPGHGDVGDQELLSYTEKLFQ